MLLSTWNCDCHVRFDCGLLDPTTNRRAAETTSLLRLVWDGISCSSCVRPKTHQPEPLRGVGTCRLTFWLTIPHVPDTSSTIIEMRHCPFVHKLPLTRLEGDRPTVMPWYRLDVVSYHSAAWRKIRLPVLTPVPTAAKSPVWTPPKPGAIENAEGTAPLTSCRLSRHILTCHDDMSALCRTMRLALAIDDVLGDEDP